MDGMGGVGMGSLAGFAAGAIDVVLYTDVVNSCSVACCATRSIDHKGL